MKSDVITILIERASHLPLALELKDREAGQVRLLALSPAVMEALDDLGEPYHTPEDFVPAAALKEQGREHYARLEAFGRYLETVLPPELTDPNPVWVHYYTLKILIDSVAFRVRQLTAALADSRKAVAFRSPDDPFWKPGPHYEFIVSDGPVYAAVAPFVAASAGISLDLNDAAPLGAGTSAWRRAWRDGREAVAQLAASARAMAVTRHDQAAISYGGVRHDMPALLDSVGDPVPVDVWAATGIGRRLSSIAGARAADRRLRTTARSAWAAAAPEIAAHPLFRTTGIDIFPLVKAPLQAMITDGAVDRARCRRVARAIARRTRLALAVHSGRYQDAILSLACGEAGVPVIYGQEGGFHGYVDSPMHHHCELSLGSEFIAYSPAVAARLNADRKTDRQRATAVGAGAQYLRAWAERSRPAPRSAIERVMYVPTEFLHGETYAPLCFSDREYYRLKQCVLRTLLATNAAEILYKPLPGSRYADDCRRLIDTHRGRIGVVETSMVDALEAADLFVLDWPATTLLEVLTTDRPVVVLLHADVIDADPDAMALLARRAWVSTSVGQFMEHIRCAVSGVRGPDPLDSRFLHAYGTGGDDAWTPADLVDFFERRR